MSERWAAVPDWEGLYEVSTEGRVRGLDRTVPRRGQGVVRIRGRVLTALPASQRGYPQVNLRSADRRARRWVHRLVLLAFVGPAPAGHVARHLNGVVADSRLENLAWGTLSENMHDAVRHGTHAWASRTTCRAFGHPLESPNLRMDRGRRRCLACSRAQSRANELRRQGRPADLAALAAEKYARIMEVVA